MKHQRKQGDHIRVGDKFNAYIRKSCDSKTLGGVELADCPVSINPQIAIEGTTSLKVVTDDAVFTMTRFYFKKTG